MLRISTIIAIAAIAAVAGCKLTGGGFIPSADWNSDIYEARSASPKAQFAFNAECTNVGEPGETIELDEASGSFQFSDNGSFNADGDVVRIHGRIDGTVFVVPSPFEFMICQQPNDEGPFGFYSGKYQAQPKTLGSGEFVFGLEDGGEPGPSHGDRFNISIFSGPFAGYFNEGFVEGGNIQYHY